MVSTTNYNYDNNVTPQRLTNVSREVVHCKIEQIRAEI